MSDLKPEEADRFYSMMANSKGIIPEWYSMDNHIKELLLKPTGITYEVIPDMKIPVIWYDNAKTEQSSIMRFEPKGHAYFEVGTYPSGKECCLIAIDEDGSRHSILDGWPPDKIHEAIERKRQSISDGKVLGIDKTQYL